MSDIYNESSINSAMFGMTLSKNKHLKANHFLKLSVLK